MAPDRTFVQVGLAGGRTKAGADDGSYDCIDRITHLIRTAIIGSGAGERFPDAPFREIIESGSCVLLKPNWVTHHNESGHGLDCLVTHPRFLRAVIREVRKAEARTNRDWGCSDPRL